ncbi:MAG: hypothetical protein BGO51_25185 [Rhodospirillales bacterium 69-11]|nr:hypothetical protein [Rhodospirillales bacterium]OJW28181.1 MAG: hypothetical protein BGO51_25185 [Rhodospirillales bacterium 69-11]
MTAVERITFHPGQQEPPACFALIEGWGRPEDTEVWMKDGQARLRIPAPPSGSAYLVLGLRAPAAPSRRGLTVMAGERVLGRYHVTGPTTRAIRLPAELAGTPEGLVLTFLAGDGPVNLRFAALQPDHPAAPPPPADDDGSDRALMLRFESLGENCEFGLVQRAYGAEPIGLMRFASTDLRRLLLALDGGFAGIGAPEALTVEVSKDEYMVSDRVYGLHYHAWVLTRDMSAEEVHAREVRRVPFLVRKLTEDLAGGHKIFVRSSRGIETEEEAYALVPSLRRWGPNELLFVLQADAAHAPGTVERRAPGFLVGYVERFAPGENAHDFLAPQWRAICRAAEALVWPAAAPADRGHGTPRMAALRGP